MVTNYVCDFGRDAGGGKKWPISNKMNKSKMFIGVIYHKNTKQSKYINILRGNIAHIITFNAIVIISNSTTGMDEYIYVEKPATIMHCTWYDK